MTNEHLLSVSGLCFSFGSRSILSEISFELNSSELVSIVGPNGAGKTTVLKCLCGIYRGYSGSIIIDGRDMKTLSQRDLAKMVALVPQGVSFLSGMSVREYLVSARYPFKSFGQGISKDDSRIIDASLDLLDLRQFERADLLELSGGERQKVVIAGALTQSPKLLLLDEPTTYLDPKFQVELVQLLLRLKVERSLAILSVTHDLNVALAGAGRLIGLKNGRIEISVQSDDRQLSRELERLFDTEFIELNSDRRTIITPNWDRGR